MEPPDPPDPQYVTDVVGAKARALLRSAAADAAVSGRPFYLQVCTWSRPGEGIAARRVVACIWEALVHGCGLQVLGLGWLRGAGGCTPCPLLLLLRPQLAPLCMRADCRARVRCTRVFTYVLVPARLPAAVRQVAPPAPHHSMHYE